MMRAVWRCVSCKQERVYSFEPPPPAHLEEIKGVTMLKCQGRCHPTHTAHEYERMSYEWVGPASPLPWRSGEKSSTHQS